MAGIRDWKEKVEAIHIVMNTSSYSELIEKVMGDRAPQGLADNMRKWDSGNTKIGMPFIKELLLELDCDRSLTATAFVVCSFDKFLESLPYQKRRSVEWVFDDKDWGELQSLGSDGYFHKFRFHPDLPISGISKALQTGNIDQKYLYMDSGAATRWRNVVMMDQYPNYKECTKGLKKLCKASFWKDYIADQTFGGIFSLGAGSPEKDNVLLESLRDSANSRPLFAWVDASPFMACHAVKWVNDHWKPANIDREVAFEACIMDFAALKDIRQEMEGSEFLSQKNYAWIMPGGTIGNLDEMEFMATARRTLCPGDILVIGAECTDGQNQEVLAASLTEKYNYKEARHFAIAPLLSHLDLINPKISFEDLRERVLVSVSDSTDLSAVNGAVSVEISVEAQLPGRGRNVIAIAKSSRYPEEEFVKFAAGCGFNCIEIIAASEKSSYKHFVFAYGTGAT